MRAASAELLDALPPTGRAASRWLVNRATGHLDLRSRAVLVYVLPRTRQ